MKSDASNPYTKTDQILCLRSVWRRIVQHATFMALIQAEPAPQNQLWTDGLSADLHGAVASLIYPQISDPSRAFAIDTASIRHLTSVNAWTSEMRWGSSGSKQMLLAAHFDLVGVVPDFAGVMRCFLAGAPAACN